MECYFKNICLIPFYWRIKPLLLKGVYFENFMWSISFSAPDYENYKSLLKCHVTADDYYIEIPRKNSSFRSEGGKCFFLFWWIATTSQSSSEHLNCGKSSAFSSDYIEEVSLFLGSLKGIAAKFQQGRNPCVFTLQDNIAVRDSIALGM